MVSKYIIWPALLYGIAWYFSAASSFWGPFFGLLTLILGGFFMGLVLHLRTRFFANLLGVIIGLLTISINEIPFVGPFIALAITIYFMIKKWKVLLDNLNLIVVGICMYLVVIFLPNYFHDGLTGYESWQDFLIGSLLCASVIYILEKAGYKKRRIIEYTIALPGFVFLFKAGLDANSPNALNETN